MANMLRYALSIKLWQAKFKEACQSSKLRSSIFFNSVMVSSFTTYSGNEFKAGATLFIKK